MFCCNLNSFLNFQKKIRTLRLVQAPCQQHYSTSYFQGFFNNVFFSLFHFQDVLVCSLFSNGVNCVSNWNYTYAPYCFGQQQRQCRNIFSVICAHSGVQVVMKSNSRMSTNIRKNVPTLPRLLSKTIRCISIVPIRDTIDTITE